jgi:hypothetical protein
MISLSLSQKQKEKKQMQMPKTPRKCDSVCLRLEPFDEEK